MEQSTAIDNDCMIIETETQPCNYYQDMTSSSSSQLPNDSNNEYPSKMAALLAKKVKIKLEKNIAINHYSPFHPAPFIHATAQQPEELDLLPRSVRDKQVVSQLQQMGFQNNDREIMVGLRAVEKKRMLQTEIPIPVETLVEETMLYIVTQREEQTEARKMDMAREQSESTVAEEQRMHKSSLNQILNSASIDEIIGFANNDSNVNVVVNSSMHFPSSTLLTLKQVNNNLRSILENDLPNNIAREKIVHLLALEKKAFKWYGDVLPYAYFGITLPNRLAIWCGAKEVTNQGEVYEHEVLHQLQSEIYDIEHAMYSLSEQQQGHLGLMVPKKFIEAKDIAIAQGLIEEDNVIIIDD